MLPALISKIKTNSRLRLFIGILVVWCLFSIRIFTAHVLHVQLPNKLQDLLTLSASVIIESLPFVLLGILLSILVQVWLPDKFIINRLPKWPPLRRVCT